MLEILVEENPKSDEKILLAWANVTKIVFKCGTVLVATSWYLGRIPTCAI